MTTHGHAQPRRTRLQFSGVIFTPKKRTEKRGQCDTHFRVNCLRNDNFEILIWGSHDPSRSHDVISETVRDRAKRSKFSTCYNVIFYSLLKHWVVAFGKVIFVNSGFLYCAYPWTIHAPSCGLYTLMIASYTIQCCKNKVSWSTSESAFHIIC